MSWDRLANITVSSYNVKLPAILFTLAALTALASPRRLADLRPSRLVRILAILTVVIVVVFVAASIAAARPASAFPQVAAVLTGAVLPAFAVVAAAAEGRAGVVWALRWFVAGAYFASAFGFYQLLAFYLRLPQFVTYTGVGVDGDVGRIAGFNYEPAYFADFIVLAVGAFVAIAYLRGTRPSLWAIGWYSAVLVLCNVRALVFLLPAFAILLLLRWRRNRALLVRGVVAAVIVIAANLAVTHGVLAVHDALTRHAAEAPAPPAEPSGPPAAEEPDTPANVLNPEEQSSNAPRLALYRAVLQVAAAHPLIGVGPGNLRTALAGVHYVAPNQGAQVVANNIWLQALSDGGVMLLLLEAAVIVVIVILLFRRSLTVLQPLIAAWLAVLLVSGMLTSYFFDVKIWAVLGLIVAAVTALRDPGGPALSPRRQRRAVP